MRQALEMALEALEEINKLSIGDNAICLPAEIDTAMDAIKEALAQQETPYKIGQQIAKTGGGISHLWSAVTQDGEIAEAERGFKEALAQPEQEPVAWKETDEVECPVCKDKGFPWPKCGHITYLEPTPPQRTWVDLTDDEMLMIYGQDHEGKKYNLGRMVQQALKEKNT